MKTRNFPEKKNERRKAALARLKKATFSKKEGSDRTPASWEKKVKQEMEALTNAIVISARDKRTKKDRRNRAKIRN